MAAYSIIWISLYGSKSIFHSSELVWLLCFEAASLYLYAW